MSNGHLKSKDKTKDGASMAAKKKKKKKKKKKRTDGNPLILFLIIHLP